MMDNQESGYGQKEIGCESLLETTIHFKDRVPCYQCELADPTELCPDIDNPADCPQKEYTVKVNRVSCYKVKGKIMYQINGAYEFSVDEIQRNVKIDKAG